MTARKNRSLWIDCAKCIAILAVLIDHCKGVVYESSTIQTTSFFSVSVFILLAGITSAMQFSNSNQSHKVIALKQFQKVFVAYFVACVFYEFLNYRFFDLLAFLQHVVLFESSAPFYFIVVYLQLIAIGSILYRLIVRCKASAHPVIANSICLAGCFFVAIFSWKYTYILSVHGGGTILFGGTYLVLYWLGMFLYLNDLLPRNRKSVKQLLLFSALLLSVAWVVLIYYRNLIDDLFIAVFGAGVNPPGIVLMVYAILSFLVLYAVFYLAAQSNRPFLSKTVAVVAWVGRYSLYIFLYHTGVIMVFLYTMNMLSISGWVKNCVLLVGMVFAPIALAMVFRAIQDWLTLKD